MDSEALEGKNESVEEMRECAERIKMYCLSNESCCGCPFDVGSEDYCGANWCPGTWDFEAMAQQRKDMKKNAWNQ